MFWALYYYYLFIEVSIWKSTEKVENYHDYGCDKKNVSCPNAPIFLTSDTLDILCLVNSKICTKKIVPKDLVCTSTVFIFFFF